MFWTTLCCSLSYFHNCVSLGNKLVIFILYRLCPLVRVVTNQATTVQSQWVYSACVHSAVSIQCMCTLSRPRENSQTCHSSSTTQHKLQDSSYGLKFCLLRWKFFLWQKMSSCDRKYYHVIGNFFLIQEISSYHRICPPLTGNFFQWMENFSQAR